MQRDGARRSGCERTRRRLPPIGFRPRLRSFERRRRRERRRLRRGAPQRRHERKDLRWASTSSVGGSFRRAHDTGAWSRAARTRPGSSEHELFCGDRASKVDRRRAILPSAARSIPSMDALAKVCPKCGRRYDTAASLCQKDGSSLELTEEGPDRYIGTTLLDQFKIEEKIGAGGMGSVYRARQTTLHRDVAIKTLHPELADNRDAVRRFKREARVCTALDHPNVVRVFLFGQLADGSLYIVMEFLRGRSLLDVLGREGALPVHRALHIATQICDGVGEAHAHGVVHRDIKPENIVLVAKSRDPDYVKVLDFGIARVLWGDDQTQATQSGLVFGTARYISPEGAAGEATDARSDVYSLGILTYQLLCGETPFDAQSPVAMLMKHIHSSPPHLLSNERAKHVPEPVADVVMRALSKNPEGR